MPLDVVVQSGQNATFSATATGTGSLTFQWLRSGQPIAGATGSTLVVSHAGRADADNYAVAVTDQSGTKTSYAAHLWVAPIAYPGTVTPDPRRPVLLENDRDVMVSAVAALPDGGFLAGGRISSVNGAPRSLVFRVNADDSLNTTFVPPVFVGDEVRSIALQPDGKVLVGGHFYSVGGVARNGLVRLNPDASVDVSFVPDLPSGSTVIRIVVSPDGTIIVGPAFGKISRLNADGTLNTTITDVSSGILDDIAVQPDGRILIAGWFTVFKDGLFRTNVARFNPDGSLDPTFTLPSTDKGTPEAVAVAADGSIYVGGNLTTVGGTPVSGLVRLKSDGSLDPTFAPVVTSKYGGAPMIYSVTVQSNGRILFTGEFDQVNGLDRTGIARIRSDGLVDGYAPNGLRLSYPDAVTVLTDGSVVVGCQSTGYDGAALSRFTVPGVQDALLRLRLHRPVGADAAVPLSNGRFVLFGTFNWANGLPADGILRLNADGTVDPTLHSQASAPNVTTATALPDGRIVIGTIYGLGMLDNDGRYDASFKPPTGLFRSVRALAVTPAGKILAAGEGGDGPTGVVAQLNLDGSRDPAFNGTGFNGAVNAIAMQPDGHLLVGGRFSTYHGTPVPYLARLNPDGTLDPAFSGNTHFVQNVTAIFPTPTGKIVVIGPWNDNVHYYSFVRLNADGTRDTTFTPSADSPAGALVQEDGRLLLRLASGDSLIRLNADGTVDSTFSALNLDRPSQFTPGAALLMRDNGQLLIAEGAFGGFFQTTSATPVITVAPSPQTLAPGASTTLQVTAESAWALTYQWLLNGTPIAGATNTGYAVANLMAANAGNYTVKITNQYGATTSAPVSVNAPLDTRGRIVNLSVRTDTGNGASRLILGLVVGGSGTGGSKALLYRAAGPTLASDYGVPGTLSDPMLELYGASGTKIDANDDWAGSFDFASVGAFPFRGTAPKDAGIYRPNDAGGPETVHVIGQNGGTGIALAEVYDATPGDTFTLFTPRMINGSARATAGSGGDVLILGFSVAGTAKEHLLIRGVGPTLGIAPYDVLGVLADPRLELYDANSVLIAQNDDWGANGNAVAMTSTFASAHAFPLAMPKDAALEVTLSPGTYSAVVRGVNDTTGVALVELYELP